MSAPPAAQRDFGGGRGPGERLEWLTCVRQSHVGRRRDLASRKSRGHGAGPPDTERMEGCGQQAWPRGLDPAWPLLPLGPRRLPRLLLLPQTRGRPCRAGGGREVGTWRLRPSSAWSVGGLAGPTHRQLCAEPGDPCVTTLGRGGGAGVSTAVLTLTSWGRPLRPRAGAVGGWPRHGRGHRQVQPVLPGTEDILGTQPLRAKARRAPGTRAVSRTGAAQPQGVHGPSQCAGLGRGSRGTGTG